MRTLKMLGFFPNQPQSAHNTINRLERDSQPPVTPIPWVTEDAVIGYCAI
jgi:hypothetical protein